MIWIAHVATLFPTFSVISITFGFPISHAGTVICHLTLPVVGSVVNVAGTGCPLHETACDVFARSA